MTMQSCTRCVLDSSDDPSITFDQDGVCSMCHLYDEVYRRRVLPAMQKATELQKVLQRIKRSSTGKYNCIIGISGGVDSTYVAWKVKEAGLRPLAVHLDNGWNSELAVKNIENIVNKLGIDLYTHVIDWAEFKDLQLSFLKASVVDIELLTDHAISAVMYKLAVKHNIKYVLSGENFTTEGILPPSWVFQKNDLFNINSIHKKFGSKRIRTFPTLGYFNMMAKNKMYGIQHIYYLDLIDYNKEDAKRTIQEHLDWRDYGGKHYESIFTRFYQAYILPTKFGIDKRKSHLSTLICAGQLTRDQALELLKQPICDPVQLKEDKTYVVKKFGLTEAEFDRIMLETPKPHTDYRSVRGMLNSPAFRVIRAIAKLRR